MPKVNKPMNRFAALISLIFILIIVRPLQAQSDAKPPYLYYYSQLLGGLIIERADGTSSRHIAADVIPPNLSGLSGPGWSPSGKYFAARGETYSDSPNYTSKPYLIDIKGQKVAGWLDNVMLTGLMQWSPTGEDLLLVEGAYSPVGLRDSFFWLIDVEHNELLVDFGAHFGGYGTHRSEMMWTTAHGQIVFYYESDSATASHNYRVTMHFDGTTLREPVSTDAFIPIKSDVGDDTDVYHGDNTSPSGTYKAQGVVRARLTNIRTGQVVDLPVHTGATTCRDYLWTENEDYMMTFDGTLIAGGGCYGAVLGVTNPQGSFWRELGGCSWPNSPCAGWLPRRVDISNLPVGSPKPVQLDPIKIEYTNQIQIYDIDPAVAHLLTFRCGKHDTADLREPTTQVLVYTLNGVTCPYSAHETPLPEQGRAMVVAEDPVHHLLATYTGWRDVGVTIWKLDGDAYAAILKLNTQGLELKFTDHNERLRARNFNGWKIYTVADILAYANTPK